MSDSESNTLNTRVENTEVETKKNDLSESDEIDAGLDKAIETYKKIYEKEGMPENEQKKIDSMCEIIRNRDIITQSADNKPV